jgi:hypothetical protein
MIYSTTRAIWSHARAHAQSAHSLWPRLRYRALWYTEHSLPHVVSALTRRTHVLAHFKCSSGGRLLTFFRSVCTNVTDALIRRRGVSAAMCFASPLYVQCLRHCRRARESDSEGWEYAGIDRSVDSELSVVEAMLRRSVGRWSAAKRMSPSRSVRRRTRRRSGPTPTVCLFRQNGKANGPCEAPRDTDTAVLRTKQCVQKGMEPDRTTWLEIHIETWGPVDNSRRNA